MNTATIIIAVIVVFLIIFAIYGSYKTLHNESCCCEDKNCTSGKTQHCSIKREDNP